MAFLEKEKFRFKSLALADDAFGVVRFSGTEAISSLYRFEILLVAGDHEIDTDEVLAHPAVFTILRERGEIPYHGIITRFEQLHATGPYCFYRAELVPRLWWLSLAVDNQVFMDQNIVEIIETVLKGATFSARDYEMATHGTYDDLPYVCQFRESPLNFISRWMEHTGIYYYFDQDENREKVIITDSRTRHTGIPGEGPLLYVPPGGQGEPFREEVVTELTCAHRQVPRDVVLEEWIHMPKPLVVSGRGEVDGRGHGQVHLFGEHFHTPRQGEDLARVRAEEYGCRRQRFRGRSSVSFLRPGYTFDLAGHYRPDFNQTYITVAVTHEGSQTGYLTSGIGEGVSGADGEPYYRNRFRAIAGDVQFRPRRVTEKPRYYGVLSARIDGSDGTAVMDEHGRYKVILPFDRRYEKPDDAPEPGKASSWLRLLQPYGGENYGLHFPLHPGTEVLLTFVDGDPDRPVIAGAVANPEHRSVVTSENQEHGILRSDARNEIEFKNQKDHERIVISSPCHESLIKVGDAITEKSWLDRLGVKYDDARAAKKKVDDNGGYWDSRSLDLANANFLVSAVSSVANYKKFLYMAALELAGVLGSIPGLGFLKTDAGTDKGIHLLTKEGLRIEARKKEETIGGLTNLGYEIKSVTGGRWASVTGIDDSSVTGMRSRSVKGIASEEIIGKAGLTVFGKTDLNEYALKDIVSVKVNSMVGTCRKIGGGVTKVWGKATALFAKKTKVAQEEIELMDMKDGMFVDKTELSAEQTQLNGKKTKLTGDSTEIGGQEIELKEMTTQMSADKTVVEGDRTSVTGSKTEVNGDNTKVTGKDTKISSTNTSISGQTTLM